MYAAITLLVVAADIYVWCTEPGTIRCIAATAAVAVAIIWALHYIFLRYDVDADGVREHRFLKKTRSIRWAELTGARLEEVQLQGIAGLSIILESPDTTICISSRTLALETVEELAQDLKNSEIIH